jgi:hypothetical protein
MKANKISRKTAALALALADPSVRSEGQRLLLLVPGSLAKIAAQAGCKSKQSVLNWRTGERKPNAPERAKLSLTLGIPVRTWALRPGTATAPDAPDAAVAAGGGLVDMPAPPANTLEHCLALLRVISNERSQPGLLASERVKLADAEARILALRHRLEGERELEDPQRLFRHPPFARFRTALLAALKSHPLADAEVRAELARIGDTQ